MKKRISLIIMIVCLFSLAYLYYKKSGNEQILDPKKPIVVTFWHSYNNFAKSVLDEMILDFNDTIGTEKGIIIDAYSYGEQKKLEDALYDSVNKVMGAEKMPDLFLSYADNARRIHEYVPLVDVSQYFSNEELDEYRQEFLDEGRFEEGEPPRMIPVAKSTELVFINKTQWQAFASETSELKEKDVHTVFRSWEHITKAAELYYQWSGGKPMLGINLNNDIMYVTASQLENTPYDFTGGTVKLSYNRETARNIWDICYVPHIKGWLESAFYNQDAVKSGRIIAYIGSSAGSGFFPSEVTIDASNSYPIECCVISYPSFQGTTPYMSQRGANIAITKTDPAHEYAAAEFVKWFTSDQQNISFTASTGYIPVKNTALKSKQNIHTTASQTGNADALDKSVLATLEAVNTRKFVTKRPFEHSYEVNSVFNRSIFDQIAVDLGEKERRIAAGETEQAVISQLCSEENFNKWYDGFMKELETRIE